MIIPVHRCSSNLLRTVMWVRRIWEQGGAPPWLPAPREASHRLRKECGLTARSAFVVLQAPEPNVQGREWNGRTG